MKSQRSTSTARPTARSTRALAATLALSLFAPLLTVAPAFAQPAPTTATPAADPANDPLYSCKKRSGKITVTFKPETELKDLITWVMGFTCKNFLLDPRIVSTGKKVTVIAPLPMSQTEAYNLFLASLSTMGLTVVPNGAVMKIVDAPGAKSEHVPIVRGMPANNDQIVRYILRPAHTPVEAMRQALDSIRSTAGNITTTGNLIIITDFSSQVRDMMTLARAIDVPGTNDGIYTIPVHFADATQLAGKLNEVLGVSAGAGGGGSGGGGGNQSPRRGNGGGDKSVAPDEVADAIPSKILVDDRTNTLIVAASEAGYLRVKALVERLDISLETEGGAALNIYPLQNALAEDLATTLTSALGQAGASRPGQAPGQAPRQAQPAISGFDSTSLEGQVKVIGDKATNTLLVSSSGRDYIALKDVIRKLDLPRRQVFIEALILEVQLSKTRQLGTSSHGGLPVNNGSLVLGGVQTPQLKSLDLTTLVAATGLIGGLIGKPLSNSQTVLGKTIPSYGVLFQALASQDNSNILSAPHVIAIDNEKTEFSVGNNIPYQAGLSFGGLGLGGAGGPTGSIGQNIQREKLNLSLEVTPHISNNDSVRLEILNEIKDQGGSDPQLGPTWTERRLKTQVVVADQQSVVIGGLIQERDIYSTTKVPILGDVPILGYLFKYTTKTKKKTNLLILLTPYIIKDQLDLQAIRERKVRERDEFVRSFTTLDEMKYQPRIDYRRKRGMIEEINRSVLSVEADVELLRAMGQRTQVLQGPIDYAPSTIENPDEPPPALPAPGAPTTTAPVRSPPKGK